jgi:YHS domain-containing protein
MANSETRPGADPDKAQGLKAFKDPVCGMDVSPKKSYSATHDNTEYRVCSLSCLEKFKADPEGFEEPHVRKREDGNPYERESVGEVREKRVTKVNQRLHQDKGHLAPGWLLRAPTTEYCIFGGFRGTAVRRLLSYRRWTNRVQRADLLLLRLQVQSEVRSSFGAILGQVCGNAEERPLLSVHDALR